MSKNVVESEGPQAIRRMRVACWISKATRAEAHARARVPTTTPAPTQAQAAVGRILRVVEAKVFASSLFTEGTRLNVYISFSLPQTCEIIRSSHRI
jgi:hypothetical protein